MGPIDAVALLRNDNFLTRRHDVGFGQLTLRCRVANPVDLKRNANIEYGEATHINLS